MIILGLNFKVNKISRKEMWLAIKMDGESKSNFSAFTNFFFTWNPMNNVDAANFEIMKFITLLFLKWSIGTITNKIKEKLSNIHPVTK